MNLSVLIGVCLRFLLSVMLLVVATHVGAALKPGDHEFVLRHQGLKRSYLVRVPPHASTNATLPVVLNFHGGGSNAKTQKWYSRMDETADREGFIAVYPNGSGGFGDRLLTWNAGNCCGAAALNRIDDVGFVLAVIEDLGRRMPVVDRARIYATGLSNGSMMAYRLAAEASDRIAAVAGVAGAMTLSSFAPRLPVPVMHIHSVDDQRALYAGGLGPAFPLTDTRVFHASVENMLKKWIDHNGCPAQGTVVAQVPGDAGSPDEGHSATQTTYAPCRGGTEVRVPNIMTRVMRWHDFGSGREASRSEYREYSQGSRQSHGPKLVPARRVAATTAAHFVGRLAHIRDMSCAPLRVINPFWLQRTRGSLC